MSNEKDFWNWFKENNSQYYFLNQMTPAEKEKLLDKFLVQLHKYCDNLFFEIGGIPNEMQQLIITAAGNSDYFDQVEELVVKAPDISDWEIIAFKPSMGADFITEYEDVKLNPREMWFLPLDSNKDPMELGVRIYFANYDPDRQKIFLEASYQVLDTVLGEKSATLDINYIELDLLPIEPEEKGLIELPELPKYISWRKKSRHK